MNAGRFMRSPRGSKAPEGGDGTLDERQETANAVETTLEENLGSAMSEAVSSEDGVEDPFKGMVEDMPIDADGASEEGASDSTGEAEGQAYDGQQVAEIGGEAQKAHPHSAHIEHPIWLEDRFPTLLTQEVCREEGHIGVPLYLPQERDPGRKVIRSNVDHLIAHAPVSRSD